MASRYRITVDRAACLGSGLCTGVAPNHFMLDAEYISRPREDVVDADEVVVDAAECCPTEAITVVDADTGAPVAP